jgi:hypothetical protein
MIGLAREGSIKQIMNGFLTYIQIISSIVPQHFILLVVEICVGANFLLINGRAPA